MRAFVLMILVLNLAIFGWYYYAAEEPVTTAPKALPQARPGVQSLVLVREASTTTQKAPVVAASQAPPPPESAPPVTATATVEQKPVPKPKPVPAPAKVASCYKAGPFNKRAESEGLVALVEKRGFDAAITAKKGQQFFGEWIYLTEYTTVQSARADVTALKGQGITDVAVTRLDNGELIISLGIYGQKETLKRRLAELKALGYVNYRTRKRYRDVDLFWLVMSGYEGQQQRILADELGVALKKSDSGARLTIVACK